jgi:hypothetical protein
VIVYKTADEGRKCVCGATIREDDDDTLCPKCRARVRWLRRTEGRRNRPRQRRAHRNDGR